MKMIFGILSLAYVSAIFVLASSPVVRMVAPFNFYSLLHVPLYGILTVLLAFSLIPMKKLPSSPASLTLRFLMAGLVALGVGIADEIHQAFVPGRDASVMDVFLDGIGILLVLLFVKYKNRMIQANRT